MSEHLAFTAHQHPAIAELESFIAQTPAPVMPALEHIFTPGLYCRRMTIPAGVICTSKIHKTKHQFEISQGVVKIWSPRLGWEIHASPFHGITEAGESRAVWTLQETVWSTYHATDKTDVAEIEKALFETHAIPEQVEGPCLK